MPTYEEWKRSNWDKAHREKDITALTGTGLGGHLATLQTKDLLRQGITTVLCIGVGTGGWVKEIAKIAKEVYALDVSTLSAKSLPENVLLVTDPKLLPGNKFDLAMSLWVAPHMNDPDLQLQLAEVIRSLTADGVFAIHYKEPLTTNQVVNNRLGEPREYAIARQARMLRKPRQFASMVELAGGYIIGRVQENPSQFHKIVEVSAHVGKQPLL